MSLKVFRKFSLIHLLVATLLLVGLVPLLLTGWFLSERSATELRAAEGRYQTQLVQDKARQIEMFLNRHRDLVKNFAGAFELTKDFELLSAEDGQQKIGNILRNEPSIVGIYVKPISAEPLSVYRNEIITESELESFSSSVMARLSENQIVVDKTHVLASDGEAVLAIGAPVLRDGEITAAVIAIVSLGEIAHIMSETRRMNEDSLWESNSPIVFVVGNNGRAIFYPDAEVVKSQKPLINLKIVQEWSQSSRQIQSALVPFTVERNGEEISMIGAYSTANISADQSFGVISMQKERSALASVTEMRRNTWVISLLFALVALVVGSISARQLTKPVSELVEAAKRIASGDLTSRLAANRVKEIDTLGSTFNVMSERLLEKITELETAARENRELFVGTVKALAAAIDGKDHYTRGHSERVSRVSVAIGQRLGLPEKELETLRISALLHDIGKIAIDDSILKKTTTLTNEEFEIMKQHPQRGYKIMSQIPAMLEFLPGMHMHHEMVNGQGYPRGLKGDEIPLQAKIVSVADTFDAISIDRPYQKGMSLEDSLNRIRSFVGTRYDGKVVEALVQACADGQIGKGTVKLKTSGSPSDTSSETEKKVA